METTNECGTYYVRENGRLYVHKENSISSRFRSFKRTKYYNHPLASITVSNDILPSGSCGNIPSLFNVCLNYVSTYVHNIDSLAGFPDMIAEQIFATVVNRRVLQTFADEDCASVLRTFDKAYHGVLLKKLRINSLAVLDQHVDSFSAFCHISKLDVSGCTLGDNHDYLLHIGHLTL